MAEHAPEDPDRRFPGRRSPEKRGGDGHFDVADAQ